jgi:hypothetical protein
MVHRPRLVSPGRTVRTAAHAGCLLSRAWFIVTRRSGVHPLLRTATGADDWAHEQHRRVIGLLHRLIADCISRSFDRRADPCDSNE